MLYQLTQKISEFNQILEDKFLGFFTFHTNDKKIKKILAPFACGKLYLEIYLDKKNNMEFKSYVVDFKGYFFLSPIKFQIFQN